MYVYLTTQFVVPSSYLQDGLSVVSGSKSSMLNFLGREWIDLGELPPQIYMQLQPAPTDGSAPLASNKWYMTQYELAYDATLTGKPYDSYQLSWTLNYANVAEMNLGGTVVGTINGVIGSSSPKNPISYLKNIGSSVGTGVLAGIGSKVISDNTINALTGENKLGLPNNVFKGINQGLGSALSGSVSSLPGAAFGLLNALLGGSSDSGIKPVNLTLEADITLEGRTSENGSFPSSPVSFWIPGTNITPAATGYIPLYDKTLGVINFTGKPTLIFNYDIMNYTVCPYSGFSTWPTTAQTGIQAKVVFPTRVDYSNYMVINPEVKKIATVTLVNQELVFSRNVVVDKLFNQPEGLNVTGSPRELVWNNYKYLYDKSPTCQIPHNSVCPFPDDVKFGIRFTVKVQPNDGAPATTIIKTLEVNWIMSGVYGILTPDNVNILDSDKMLYINVYKLKDKNNQPGGFKMSLGAISNLMWPSYNIQKEETNPKRRFYAFAKDWSVTGQLRAIYEKGPVMNGYEYTVTPQPGNPAFWLYKEYRPGLVPIYSIEYYKVSIKPTIPNEYYCYLTTENVPSSSILFVTINNKGVIGYSLPEK